MCVSELRKFQKTGYVTRNANQKEEAGRELCVGDVKLSQQSFVLNVKCLINELRADVWSLGLITSGY